MHISNITIFNITLRTYFVRLFYTYKSLFGYSLIFCLSPYLKNKKLDKKSRNNFLKRHSFFFNTNDFLIGYAIGIILHFEEKKEYEKVIKIKSILTSSLGAIGDKLIYKTILPVLVLIIINIITFGVFNPSYFLILLILILLFIFIASNFLLRFFSIKKGFYDGVTSIQYFKSVKFIRLNKLFYSLKLVLLVVLMINLIVVFFV